MKHEIKRLSDGVVIDLSTRPDEDGPVSPTTVRSLAAEVLEARDHYCPDDFSHSKRITLMVRPDDWPQSIEHVGAMVDEIYEAVMLRRLSIEVGGFRIIFYPKDGQTRSDAAAAICNALERKR